MVNPKKDGVTGLKARSWQEEQGGGRELPGRLQEGRVICRLVAHVGFGLSENLFKAVFC